MNIYLQETVYKLFYYKIISGKVSFVFNFTSWRDLLLFFIYYLIFVVYIFYICFQHPFMRFFIFLYFLIYLLCFLFLFFISSFIHFYFCIFLSIANYSFSFSYFHYLYSHTDFENWVFKNSFFEWNIEYFIWWNE